CDLRSAADNADSALALSRLANHHFAQSRRANRIETQIVARARVGDLSAVVYLALLHSHALRPSGIQVSASSKLAMLGTTFGRKASTKCVAFMSQICLKNVAKSFCIGKTTRRLTLCQVRIWHPGSPIGSPPGKVMANCDSQPDIATLGRNKFRLNAST